MAVEKQIENIEGDNLSLFEDLPEQATEVMETPDGGAEVTIENKALMEEAEAM